MSETAPDRPMAAPARRRRSSAAGLHPALRFEDIETEESAALIARGTAYVREYHRIEEQPTILLRNIANVLVALRSRHYTADGSVDLRGQSAEYRRDAAEIYAGAGVPPDSAASIQAAVRYHVSQVLRDVYDEATLESYGLGTASALDRTRVRMKERKAILAAATAEATVTDTDTRTRDEKAAGRISANQLRLAGSLSSILGGMSPDDITSTMTPEQRGKLDEHLADAQAKIKDLRQIIKAAGRRR